MTVVSKRAYEEATADDGFRILVDRLWPRGVSKEKASLDLWLKEVAPSNALRTWFGHDPAKWAEFKKRYRAELTGEAADAFATLKAEVRKHKRVTLVYGAKDAKHNQAEALMEFMA